MLKLNKLAIILATTFSATSAFAVPVTQTDIANAADLQQSWISGASAPTLNVFLGFAAGCDGDTLTVFHAGSAGAVTPGSSNTGNAFAYACQRGGVVSVLYHTNQGGSFNAYNPHVPNNVAGTGFGVTTILNRLANVATNSCTLVGDLGSTVPNQAGTAVYRCTSAINGFTAEDGTPTKPAGGFSDVEAALFGVEDAGDFGTEIDAGVTQVFGVMASQPLYRAMQVQQGIFADLDAANAGDPNFVPRFAPNITKQQYATLASNKNAKWSVLGLSGADAAKEVIIARRVDTSGTQASSNAFFMGNPCLGNPATGGALVPSKPSDSIPNVYTVIAGGETAEVRDAISNASTADKFALGVVSAENAAATGRRYLKIDGVHPFAGTTATTVDNNGRYTAAQGQYGFQLELKAFIANDADAFGAQVIEEIVSGLSSVPCGLVPRGLLLNNASLSCPNVTSGGVQNRGVVISRTTRDGNNCRPLTFK